MVAMALVCALGAAAETKTFYFSNYQKLDEPNGKVTEFLEGYTGFFEEDCGMENISFADGEVRFGDPKDGTKKGKLTLRLGPTLKRASIKTVSLESWAVDIMQKTAYVWVNGVKSVGFFSTDGQTTATCSLDGSLIENLEIRVSSTTVNANRPTAYYAYCLTVDYDLPEEVDPIEINPADGLGSLDDGAAVTLSSCALTGDVASVICHSSESDANQPPVRSFAVAWADGVEAPAEPVVADLTGTVSTFDGQKTIIVTSWTSAANAPEPEPLPTPAAMVNGEPVENLTAAVPADCSFSFAHPYGDDVMIYYTKRTDAVLNISSATTDPALIGAAPAAARAGAEAVDETGTYLYAGPFRPVHASNIATADQSQVAITYVAVPASTLAAAPLWGQSAAVIFGKGLITTGISDIETDSEPASYYDLQGRPCDAPRPGMLVIQITPTSARLIITPTR